MSTTVIRASSESSFIGARAGFTSIRLDTTGSVWADSRSHLPRLLTHRVEIRRLGWASETDGDVFLRHCGPEGAVWIETHDQVLVFPLDEWWPGHSVDDHERMMASSGFAGLFRQLGKAPRQWHELKRHPTSDPSDALLVSTSIDKNRLRLARLHALTAFIASLSFVVTLGLSIAAGLVEGLRPLASQLGVITSIWCTSVALVALAPASAWARWPRRQPSSSASDSILVATDRGRVMLVRRGGQLVVVDAVGTQTTFDLASERNQHAFPGELTTWGVADGGSIVVLDRTRQPRIRLLPACRAPFDQDRISESLGAFGLQCTELSEDDLARSRELEPVGGRTAGRQALFGAGPWRTPTLVTTLLPAFFIGTIALPLAVGLVDSLDADPIWAVLAISSFALFIGTYVAIAAWALWQDRHR